MNVIFAESKNLFKDENQSARAFLFEDYSKAAHKHDFYEINIVVRGEGIHQIENSHFEVKVGDVFVIPPMIVHAYYDTKNLDVYHIVLKKEFIINNQDEAKNIPGFIQLVEIEPFLRRHFSKEMFLHLSVGQMIQLKSELAFVEDDNFLDTDELSPLKTHAIWKILYWFSALLFNQIYRDSTKALGKYDIEIIKILEYIHKNYEEKITIDLLCGQSFLSRSTFIRCFYKMCACQPIEYVNKYRVKKAIEMMENTSLSKTEIAHRCGFYDLSHMEKTLKKMVLN